MPAGQVGDPSPCALQQTCCLDSSKGRGPAHTTYGPAVEHMGLVLEKGPPICSLNWAFLAYSQPPDTLGWFINQRLPTIPVHWLSHA